MPSSAKNVPSTLNSAMIRWPTTNSPHEPGESSCSAAIRIQLDITAFYSCSRPLGSSDYDRCRLALPPPSRRHLLPPIVQPPILLRLLTNSPCQDIVVPLREILHAAEFRRVIDR